MSSLDIFIKGGPVLLVLLFISVITLAIVLYKLAHFLKVGVLFSAGPRSQSFVNQCIQALNRGDRQECDEVLQDVKHPAAAVIRVFLGSGLSTSEEVAKEMQRVGNLELRDLESWLRALASIAQLSPLLGLLGTVVGMIQAFIEFQSSSVKADSSLLAGGIWEALLTTAFGLVIAIPAMAAFYFLESRVDAVKATMSNASTQLLLRCTSPQVGSEDPLSSNARQADGV